MEHRRNRMAIVMTCLLAGVMLLGAFVNPTQAISMGDRVGVTYDGGKVNVRDKPGTQGTTVIGHRHTGQEGEVIGGPVDKDGYRWWKIRGYGHDSNDRPAWLEGWSAEGSGNTAWYKEMPGEGTYPVAEVKGGE